MRPGDEPDMAFLRRVARPIRWLLPLYARNAREFFAAAHRCAFWAGIGASTAG
jgi:hypothetical protein